MIRHLTVLHLARTAGHPAPPAGWERCLPPSSATSCWRLETCQRSLFVSLNPASRVAVPLVALPPGVEIFHGATAYEFLLRVATGLASELAGETNILGQLKAAWSHQSRQSPWLQWLFADAKEIRANYLSSVGGASYGRLVRQLLRSAGGLDAGPVLIVGAGDMAETVCPWLRATPMQILNRTPARAEALARQLQEQPGATVEVVAADQAEAAWRNAGAVVVCAPFDPVEDVLRQEWLRPAGPNEFARPVIHLGGNRQDAGDWSTLPQFHCLDDLYTLQRQSDGRQARQLGLAFQACLERARHRLLGSSLSHPHGWEDLPGFFPAPDFAHAGSVTAEFAPAAWAA